MGEWRSGVYRWLARHDGVITRSRASELGCFEPAFRRMVARGELIPIGAGAYRSGHVPTTDRQLLIAACLVHPSAAIGGLSACAEWGLRGAGDHPPEVLVRHGSQLAIGGLIVRRSRTLIDDDIVRRPGHLRITTVQRSLYDSADRLGVQRTVSAFEQALDERSVTYEMVADLLARMRRASPAMRRALVARPPWQAAVQSDLELRVLREIRRQRLPEPVCQFVVELADRRVRLDFAWPLLRVALEVDHPAWHAGSLSSHRDKGRDRTLGALGWITARLTDLDVRNGLPEAIHQVGQILAHRRTMLASA